MEAREFALQRPVQSHAPDRSPELGAVASPSAETFGGRAAPRDVRATLHMDLSRALGSRASYPRSADTGRRAPRGFGFAVRQRPGPERLQEGVSATRALGNVPTAVAARRCVHPAGGRAVGQRSESGIMTDSGKESVRASERARSASVVVKTPTTLPCCVTSAEPHLCFDISRAATSSASSGPTV